MKRFVVIPVVVAFSLTSFGCASMETMSGREKGASIGALTGAVAGALLAGGGAKSKVLASLLGAAIGGGVGYWIGNHHDEQIRSREQALQEIRKSDAHNAQKQTVFAIEDSTLNKSVARPGDEVVCGVQYTVIEKEPSARVKIVEKRYIEIDSDRFPLDTKTVDRGQGTHASMIKFTVPKDVGEYKVITVIEKEGKSIKSENPIKIVA